MVSNFLYHPVFKLFKSNNFKTREIKMNFKHAFKNDFFILMHFLKGIIKYFLFIACIHVIIKKILICKNNF